MSVEQEFVTKYDWPDFYVIGSSSVLQGQREPAKSASAFP
jgi:hypothetical protein